MTQLAELHQKIDTLPPECFGEVIDFVGYLQKKAQKKTVSLEKAEEVAEREPPYPQSEGQKSEALDTSVDKTLFPKHAECMEYWKKTYPPKIVEMLSTPSPRFEKLAGCLADANFGDKTYKELRDEMMEEKWQKYLSLN